MINLFWTRILIPKEEDEPSSKENEPENQDETESNSSIGKKWKYTMPLKMHISHSKSFICNFK